MAKSRKVEPKTLKLCEGVGFSPNLRPTPGTYVQHFVVLMQSMHSGTEVFGPFMSEEAACLWVQKDSDGELYSHHGSRRVEGVTFHVKWLEVPTKAEY
jgi:hypothetical protein